MDNKTYLFQPEKKILKQGFFMTDENNNIVYEAKMLKQPLIGSMQFCFINHLTNKQEEHKVSQTVTTTSSGLLEGFSTKSHFKYDGKNIWDYLHEVGIRIDSHLKEGKLGMTYNVTLEGQPLATITTTTPGGKSIITTRYFYDITTSEKNIDLAFLTAFSIARTEQIFYD